MRSRLKLSWPLVAVMGILAVLILAGRDSVITWSLAAIVGAIIGVELVGFPPKRGK